MNVFAKIRGAYLAFQKAWKQDPEVETFDPAWSRSELSNEQKQVTSYLVQRGIRAAQVGGFDKLEALERQECLPAAVPSAAPGVEGR